MMIKSEEYEISLLSETKQHYFFIYFRDIQRRQKKINMLKCLRVCNFKSHVVYVCVHVFLLRNYFFKKHIYFYICPWYYLTLIALLCCAIKPKIDNRL